MTTRLIESKIVIVILFVYTLTAYGIVMNQDIFDEDMEEGNGTVEWSGQGEDMEYYVIENPSDGTYGLTVEGVLIIHEGVSVYFRCQGEAENALRITGESSALIVDGNENDHVFIGTKHDNYYWFWNGIIVDDGAYCEICYAEIYKEAGAWGLGFNRGGYGIWIYDGSVDIENSEIACSGHGDIILDDENAIASVANTIFTPWPGYGAMTLVHGIHGYASFSNCEFSGSTNAVQSVFNNGAPGRCIFIEEDAEIEISNSILSTNISVYLTEPACILQNGEDSELAISESVIQCTDETNPLRYGIVIQDGQAEIINNCISDLNYGIVICENSNMLLMHNNFIYDIWNKYNGEQLIENTGNGITCIPGEQSNSNNIRIYNNIIFDCEGNCVELDEYARADIVFNTFRVLRNIHHLPSYFLQMLKNHKYHCRNNPCSGRFIDHRRELSRLIRSLC